MRIERPSKDGRCMRFPMARLSASCLRQCDLRWSLKSRAVDQSSHAQQDAMIDEGGKARRAGAGSVLREYVNVPRVEPWIMTTRPAAFTGSPFRLSSPSRTDECA